MSRNSLLRVFRSAAALVCLSTLSYAAAPVISYVEVVSITDTGAVITWRTDSVSSSSVLYGITGLTNTFSTADADTRYHSLKLTGLANNTRYYYKVRSANADGTTDSSQGSFTTLQTPDGTYLFSFATFTDLQYAKGKADVKSPRGRPYSSSEAILNALVSDINSHSPSFTIMKGDVAEASSPGYGDQVLSDEIPKFNTLTGNTVSGFTNKYFAVPGNHDKQNSYAGGNWVSRNMGLLVPEKIAVSPTTDSDFNYSFDYGNYHFIMLDSTRSSTPYGGHVDTSWLTSDLDSNPTKKTFIFMHHPAGDVTSTPPSEEIFGVTISEWQIDNISTFQSIIKSRRSQIAAVFIGHVHDNHYFASDEATGGVPFVRTASPIQFPMGYNIYKVYSGGFMQTFYKLSNTQLTEYGRDQIATGEGQSNDHWMQFWMGSDSSRNFTQTYSVLPIYAPSVLRMVPTAGATSVALNTKIIVVFSQAMDAASAQSAFSMTPSRSGTFSWDSTGTEMTFTPSGDLLPSTAYTLKISTAAKDTSGTAMAADQSSSITTGTGTATNAPTITFDRLTNDITTNITPSITGTATDGASDITSVECRIDGGAWQAVTPVDGMFSSSSESFVFTVSSPLSRGYHTVEARASNAIGLISEAPYSSYTFILTGSAPYVSARFDGTSAVNNDWITATPLIELTVLTASTLDTSSIKLKIDDVPVMGFTITKQSEILYLVSYKVTSALSDGTHTVSMEGSDVDGDTGTWQITGLSVKSSGAAQSQGSPLNYPNPFDPSSGTTISFTLTKDSDVDMNVYDISGNLITKKTYLSGSQGGKAGYNEVLWDGKADNGDLIGNGMYLYMLIIDGKMAGKGKMVAFRK